MGLILERVGWPLNLSTIVSVTVKSSAESELIVPPDHFTSTISTATRSGPSIMAARVLPHG
jgi:hypothetical protein